LVHDADDYSQSNYDTHYYKLEGIPEIDLPFILAGIRRDRRGPRIGRLREQRTEL
jgi:hypothetical protein